MANNMKWNQTKKRNSKNGEEKRNEEEAGVYQSIKMSF